MEAAKLVSIPLRNPHASSGGEGQPPIYPSKRTNSSSPTPEDEEKGSASVKGGPEIIDRAMRSEIPVQEMTILDTKINEHFLKLCQETGVDPDSERGEGLKGVVTLEVNTLYKKCEKLININTYKNENFQRAHVLSSIKKLLAKPKKKMKDSGVEFLRINRSTISSCIYRVLSDVLT